MCLRDRAPDQVMYVWFDALLNYYTALGYAREGEDLTARYWPANRHIIAKDILKFHTVYWPAFLMAADLEPPQSVYVHGYLLMGEKKMSKSLGNVLDPFEVIDRFGADALRFYCFREVRFGQDGSISTPGFEARYESELANDFGNLASRTLAMVDRYRNAVVPDPPGGDAAPAADDAELTEALDEIWTAVRRLNRYVEETRPWESAKSEEAADAERLDSALYSLTEGFGSSPCSWFRTCPRAPNACSAPWPSPRAPRPISARAAAASASNGCRRCFPRSRPRHPRTNPPVWRLVTKRTNLPSARAGPRHARAGPYCARAGPRYARADSRHARAEPHCVRSR